MKTYFTKKLKRISDDIQSNTNSVVRYANELDIKSLIQATEYLRSNKQKHEEFSKDACIVLPVSDIIEMLNNKVISERDASYAYKYEKEITLNERDLLCKVSWSFKESKIKN